MIARQGCIASAVLAALLVAAPARAGDASNWWRQGIEAAQGAGTELAIRTREAIVLGGILLDRNRHTVSGAVIGCAAGSAVAASAVVLAGTVTSGVALGGSEAALLAGCGAGAAAAGAMGYSLDHMFDEPPG